jgi:hypothetical protein
MVLETIEFNNNCQQEINGFVDYKYVTPQLNKFVQNKIKQINKRCLGQIDTFIYPENEPKYTIRVSSEFNIFEVLYYQMIHFFNV